MHALEPTMATTRYKCPGCDLTFSGTSGIIKHLKSVMADHPLVAPPITQEATRVVCSMKDGFWVVEAPPTTAPTGQSRSWRHVLGFVDETGAGKFSSDQGKFYSYLVSHFNTKCRRFYRQSSAANACGSGRSSSGQNQRGVQVLEECSFSFFHDGEPEHCRSDTWGGALNTFFQHLSEI